MKQEPIIFKQGEENGIVIERNHFERSIFKNQYQQAIKTFCHIWAQQKRYLENNNQPAKFWNKYGVDNLFANVIAFCGDRGEGKSSSMISFASILTEKEVRKEAVVSLDIDEQTKQDLSKIEAEQIELLGVIDPSFFDQEHNLLELLLGRMHSNISKIIEEKESCGKACAFDHRQIMERFQKVKSCLKILEKGNKIYDELENLNDLAAGINLQENLHKLLECYAKFMEKEHLVVCIDDIDLNIQEGYEMAELLRKYLLTSPRLIVLVAVKLDQLEDVIANAHKRIFREDELGWNTCKLMARKYVDKLLPRSNRIVMPSMNELSDRDLILKDEDTKDIIEMTPVKEIVTQLIFQKTGYVFYNTRYLSPIIPENLRSLRHLLATLISLPDARDENWDDDETGREVFKDYFFGAWVEANLNQKDYAFAQHLADYDDLSTLNAFTVEYFAKRIKEDEKIEFKPETGIGKGNQTKDITSQEQDDEDDIEEIALKEEYIRLYNDITNRSNTSTNISYGDVMYVLWLINGISLNKDIQKLIFFIKTVYSMRLYACYNVISEEPNESKPSNLYPPIPDVENEIHIHQADRWYEHINQVQRLVNGAYFTYPQGALLPKTKGKQYRDKKTIDFKVLKRWLLEIKDAYNTDTNILAEDKVALLKVCELIALYIVRTTDKEEKEKDLGHNRMAKVPSHLWQFSNTARYAIIDFLQPFYSLCNIEYAYRRFDNIMGIGENDTTYSLYNIALSTKNSLLNQLYNSSYSKSEIDRNKSDEEIFWKKQHCLISDAVIRISDVQWAIYDELLRSRNLHKSKEGVIPLAYSDIQSLHMKLYALKRKDNPKGKAWILPFRFLSILSSVLSMDNDLDNTKAKDKEIKETEYAFIQNKLEEISILSENNTNEDSALPRIWIKIYNTLRRKKWPKKGSKIRSNISSATDLSKEQRKNLTAYLKNIFDDEKEYSFEDVSALMPNILAQYYMAQAVNNIQAQ